MILDIVVAVILAFGFYLGYERGLIRTVFDTASLLVGIVVTLKFFNISAKIVQGIIGGQQWVSMIVGIVLTFIIVMALIRFIGKKLEQFLSVVNLNFVNKLAGGVLQSLFFGLLISLSLYFLDSLKLLEEKTKIESKSYTMLEPLPRKSQDVFVKLKPLFTDFWEMMQEAMDEVKQKAEDAENEPK